MTNEQRLKEITDDILAHTACGYEVCESCTKPVPGEGNPDAEIMLVGEAPGKNEDLQGRPFVGTAGKLLDELIASIGMKREDVFICNVLKHRPPGNRDPLPDEVAHEWPWLKAQVEVIHPKLIVLLGRHAMDRFLPDLKISLDHGRGKRYRGQVYYPVYHPAAALYNGSLKDTLFEDFAGIPSLLKKIDESPVARAEIQPTGEAGEKTTPASNEQQASIQTETQSSLLP